MSVFLKFEDGEVVEEIDASMYHAEVDHGVMKVTLFNHQGSAIATHNRVKSASEGGSL